MAANQQPRKAGSTAQNKAVLGGTGFVPGLVVGAVVGLVAGLVIMNITGSSGGSGSSSGGGAPAPITGGQAPGPDRIKLSRDIAQFEEIVKKDPGNYQAWVSIGNDYFDLGEAQKSVEAYTRALAIKDGDPNVMTDLGIMYRQLKEFPKAVAMFRKAAAAGPTHAQSRLNLGVVLIHDLNDVPGAIAAWEDYLKAAPNDANAENIRRSLQELRSRGTAGGGVNLDQAARDLAEQANSPAAK